MSHEMFSPRFLAGRRTRIWLTFSLAIVLTIVGAYLTWSFQRRAERARFEQRVLRAVYEIQLRFGVCERLLQVAAAAAFPGLTSGQKWKDYAAALDLKATLPEVHEFGTIDVANNSNRLLIAYAPTDSASGEPALKRNVAPEIMLRKPVDAAKKGNERSVYARIDLRRLAEQALQANTPEMQVGAIREDSSGHQAARFDNRAEMDNGRALQRSSVRVVLAGNPWTFEFTAPTALPAAWPLQYLPYLVLVSGALISLALLALGLRRRAAPAGPAIGNLDISKRYEHAQTIVRFGDYSIRIGPASQQPPDQWSMFMYALLGRSPAAGPLSSALYISRYVHPDDQAHVRRIREAALADCDAASIEYRIVGANGELKYVRDHLEYVSSADGVRTYFGLLLDVSDHRQMEIERLESAAKYQELVEQLGGIPYIGTLDHFGTNVHVSPEIMRLLGFSREQWCRDPGLRLRQIHALDREKVLEALHRSISEREPLSIDYRIYRSDGSVCWLHDEARVITDAAHTPLFLQGFLTDISERKSAQEDLQQTHRELKKLTSALDAVREENQRRLAQEMHDDLGQLLAAMKIDLSDLQRHASEFDAKALQRLDRIGDLVNAMITSVRRIVADLPPIALEERGLFNALELMIENFEQRYRIPCELQLPRDEPEITGTTAGAIYRIVQEALNNVARHAEAGRVAISLSKIDRRLELRVSDNGVGMPPGADHKFGSFGLIGMRERTFALNGSMEIESAAGAGTTICITIPERSDDGATVAA